VSGRAARAGVSRATAGACASCAAAVLVIEVAAIAIAAQIISFFITPGSLD
jgi:hypothetical protein